MGQSKEDFPCPEIHKSKAAFTHAKASTLPIIASSRRRFVYFSCQLLIQRCVVACSSKQSDRRAEFCKNYDFSTSHRTLGEDSPMISQLFSQICLTGKNSLTLTLALTSSDSSWVQANATIALLELKYAVCLGL